MLEILSYILAVEMTSLTSKFDGSQYKTGNNLITTRAKREAKIEQIPIFIR